MIRPRKAVVLAAGFGFRLDPLTRCLPKPLVPFWNEPVLKRLLRQLHAWGVRDVLINLHHHPGPLYDFIRTHAGRLGLQVACSFEPEIAGTGGALRHAAWFFDNNPFWIVNGDIVMDLDPHPFLSCMARHAAPAVLWMTDQAGPRTVQVEQGIIRRFRGGSPDQPGSFTFCGLHLVAPEILACIPHASFSSIITAYENAMSAGRPVRGVCVPGSFWADIGNPGQYRTAHIQALQEQRFNLSIQAVRRHLAKTCPGVLADTASAIHPGARVGQGSIVQRSIIMDQARVSAPSRIIDSMLAPGVHVRGTLKGVMALPVQAMNPAWPDQIRRGLHVNPDRCWAEPLDLRGSARVFTRIRSPRGSVIHVQYSLERPENARFVPNARFLYRHGIPVPRIRWHDPASRELLMEDLGRNDLLTHIQSKGMRAVESAYRQVIDGMIRLHRLAKAARSEHLDLCPAFTSTLYRWEHDLFLTHAVATRPDIPRIDRTSLRRDLNAIMRRLVVQPRVLVHRDFQSTNLLIRNHRIYLIDFQGMRMGPALYDLASLLEDPYARLPETLKTALLTYWCEQTAQAGDTAETAYRYAAVQRLLQAAGAYGRLGAMPGTRRFGEFLPPTLLRIGELLSTLPALNALKTLIRRLA